jgi:hypothetical protein
MQITALKRSQYPTGSHGFPTLMPQPRFYTGVAYVSSGQMGRWLSLDIALAFYDPQGDRRQPVVSGSKGAEAPETPDRPAAPHQKAYKKEAMYAQQSQEESDA